MQTVHEGSKVVLTNIEVLKQSASITTVPSVKSMFIAEELKPYIKLVIIIENNKTKRRGLTNLFIELLFSLFQFIFKNFFFIGILK